VTKRFRWDDWNRNHVAKHGVSESEAEHVARYARPPFPRQVEDEKFVVWGQTADGRLLQVIYIFDNEAGYNYERMNLEDILAMADDDAPPLYVIHARDLSSREKKLYRRTR
jgi:uncharacterized DUF497 family protein